MDKVQLKDFNDEISIQICSVSYADKTKTNKRIMLHVAPINKHVCFSIFRNGTWYDTYAILEDAIEAYNKIM